MDAAVDARAGSKDVSRADEETAHPLIPRFDIMGLLGWRPEKFKPENVVLEVKVGRMPEQVS